MRVTKHLKTKSSKTIIRITGKNTSSIKHKTKTEHNSPNAIYPNPYPYIKIKQLGAYKHINGQTKARQYKINVNIKKKSISKDIKYTE